MSHPLRLNLRELDAPFALFCSTHGVSAGAVLSQIAAHLASGSAEALALAPVAPVRRQRDVHFKTAEDRARAEAIAAGLGLSLSSTIRQLLLNYLFARLSDRPASNGEQLADQPLLLKRHLAINSGRIKGGKKHRLELQLSQNEIDAFTELANEHGFENLQALVITVLRAFVTIKPVLSKADQAFIGQTNLALVRVGSNINQIARAANQMKNFDATQLTRLADAADAIKVQSKEISDLIFSLSKRWDLIKEDGNHD